MTVGRMLDLTYRLNVGILSLSMNKMKDLGDPTTWVSKTDNRILGPQTSLGASRQLNDEGTKPLSLIF